MYEISKENYLLSCDKTKLNISVIHNFLANESYWAKGIPLSILKKCIDNSLCFGLYELNNQIGFARMITDYSTFAYLADVFVLSEHRGKGLSKWMMQFIMKHPDLQGLRRIMLATRDAQGLYKQFGFTELDDPKRYMQIKISDIYINNI